MMLELESGRSRAARWVAAVALVGAVQGAALALALRAPAVEDRESQAGGAFIVELSPVTAAPDEEANDVAIGERSTEVAAVAASTPQVAAAAEPEPDDQPVLPETAHPPPDETIARRLEEKPPERERPPETSAGAAEEAPAVAAVAPSEAAAPQRIENATEKAEKPKGEHAGVSRIDRAAIQNWQRDLVAHMNRHKRFPERARDARQNGVVSIAFAIDREGRLIRAAVVKGSGMEILDQAAVDMLKRASPLPAPPDSVTGEAIEFVVPVRFRWRS